MKMIAEFRPALVFVGKFLGFYLVANIVYGLWIESFGQSADPATAWLASQTVHLLNMFGFDAHAFASTTQPIVVLSENSKAILSVYEGCNGLNVVFVFAAFLLAFGPLNWRTLAFFGGGVLAIHFVNLGRIIWLFKLSYENSLNFYYFHKYVFTAVIYAAVFGMWLLWIMLANTGKLNGSYK